jgi:predicted nucleic acid-binding protein
LPGFIAKDGYVRCGGNSVGKEISKLCDVIMVLAETSVWIGYFNGVSNWQTERLDLLLDTEPVALGDLILTEVLQGFRKDTDLRKAQAFLAELPFYELGGYEVCLHAARNYRALRAKGLTVHKTIDVIIATACIEWDFELLHNDRDFDALQQILGLQVVQEG